MAPNLSKDSIWRQMNYTPPRGPCNHKDSLLSPKCPCLRFMLHPLKVRVHLSRFSFPLYFQHLFNHVYMLPNETRELFSLLFN